MTRFGGEKRGEGGGGGLPVELILDVLLRDLQPRGQAINDTADTLSVRLAESCDTECVAEGTTSCYNHEGATANERGVAFTTSSADAVGDESRPGRGARQCGSPGPGDAGTPGSGDHLELVGEMQRKTWVDG